MNPFIQIAGIHDLKEALMLAEAGVDALGFPFRLDHHTEDLPESEARAIIAQLPAAVRPLLITYLDRAEDIIELSRYLGVRGVQLHGKIRLEEAGLLKGQAPDLWLIKSLVVRRGNEAGLSEEMAAWSSTADAFLTDTYDPESGASGATGKTHDWEVSRRLAKGCSKPLILAGGLSSQNVGEAMERVKPWGVDVHSGVEGKDGRKDPDLVKAFTRAARRAFTAV